MNFFKESELIEFVPFLREKNTPVFFFSPVSEKKIQLSSDLSELVAFYFSGKKKYGTFAPSH